MARIRTIKPDFFSSADIVSLSPLARLLYIALWCEADKEGRLRWNPLTFKLRYMAGDNVEVVALCQEILSAGLVKLYGDGLAYIPSFNKHQHINPRESASDLPDPAKNDASGTRQARASDPQGGREGKGREGKVDDASDAAPPPDDPKGDPKPEIPRASRLPADWKLPADWRDWSKGERADVDPDREADRFADYWRAKPGKDGTKLDWLATWRNWIRGVRAPQVVDSASQKPGGGRREL